MHIITHRRHRVNIGLAERWLSAFGGGVLAAAGIKKRSLGGIALAAAGGALIRRAVTGHCEFYAAMGVRTVGKGQGAETTSVPYELGIRVDKAVTIAKPRAEIFRFWRDVSNLSRFMKHVESVRDLGDGKTHWIVKAPAGRKVEWDAVIHNEIEGQMIAWRSLPGSDVDNAGSVWFTDAPGERGTEVKIELQYNPPAGAVGAVVAKLFGGEPEMQIEEDLRHLKQILETGEIPTTEGQPSGRQPRKTPTERQQDDKDVEFASQASFPASDPSSFNRSAT